VTPVTAADLDRWEALAAAATRCPLCGATVRSLTRESGGRWSLSCGDWITDDQAAPILAARGDDT